MGSVGWLVAGMDSSSMFDVGSLLGGSIGVSIVEIEAPPRPDPAPPLPLPLPLPRPVLSVEGILICLCFARKHFGCGLQCVRW